MTASTRTGGFRQVRYDDPAVSALVARLQQEYVARYGGQDDTPISVDELRPPDGVFLVTYGAEGSGARTAPAKPAPPQRCSAGSVRVSQGTLRNRRAAPRGDGAEGVPVAMGGWRRHVEARSGRVPGERVVEIKRMYVVPEARGLGLARRLLAELERLARASGADQIVLETGLAQPEAIALYRSAGYVDIDGFGHYCASDQSVHLGKPLR